MKLSVLLLALYLPSTQAFWSIFENTFFTRLNDLFPQVASPLVNFLAQSSCDLGSLALGLTEIGQCSCMGTLTGFFNIAAEVECTLPDLLCIGDGSEDDVCGEVSYAAGFTAGGSGLSGNARGCLNVQTILPNLPLIGAIDPFDKLCIEGITPSNADGMEFGGCNVSYGGQSCECSLCPSRIAVSVDCSMVNLSPVAGIVINGPKLPCSFLDFVPELIGL